MLEKYSDFDVGGKTSRKKVNVLHLLTLSFVLNVILKVKVLVNSIHASKAKRATECHYST